MKTFGDNLKAERLSKGMSQGELAKAIGVKQQQISQWELNKVEPGLSSVIALLRALDIDFEDLIDGIDFEEKQV